MTKSTAKLKYIGNPGFLHKKYDLGINFFLVGFFRAEKLKCHEIHIFGFNRKIKLPQFLQKFPVITVQL